MTFVKYGDAEHQAILVQRETVYTVSRALSEDAATSDEVVWSGRGRSSKHQKMLRKQLEVARDVIQNLLDQE